MGMQYSAWRTDLPLSFGSRASESNSIVARLFFSKQIVERALMLPDQ